MGSSNVCDGLIKTNNSSFGTKREDKSVNTNIGIGDYAIGTEPLTLSTCGLGSCVAVILYHKETKCGGLVHIMLPSTEKENPESPYKYATHAIPHLISEVSAEANAEIEELDVKLVGGSKMFDYIEFSKNVGEKNINKSKKILKKYGLKITGEDIGGTSGRKITFDLTDGSVEVKVSSKNKTKIL